MRRDLEVFDMILSGLQVLNVVHYDLIGPEGVLCCSL